MDQQDTETTTQTSGVTRRSLVRTGANAAWAVPVIVAVTAAPALASSGNANVTTTITQPLRNIITGSVPIVATFTNANTGAPTMMKVFMKITLATGADPANCASDTPAGYTLLGTTTAASPPSKTFSFNATTPIAGAATTTTTATKNFDPTLTLTGTANAGVIIGILPTVSPGTATGATAMST